MGEYNGKNIVIHAEAFRETEIESLVIGEGVISIGKRAFYKSGIYNGITLSQTLVEIGDSAFHGCYFDSVTIPKNVVKIGQNAFAEYTYITFDDVEGWYTTTSYSSAATKVDVSDPEENAAYLKQYILTKKNGQ